MKVATSSAVIKENVLTAAVTLLAVLVSVRSKDVFVLPVMVLLCYRKMNKQETRQKKMRPKMQ